jgi:hypothetical protein
MSIIDALLLCHVSWFIVIQSGSKKIFSSQRYEIDIDGTYGEKPSLTVNVIDFEFFGFNVTLWVPWSSLGVPLVSKEIFRFTRYLERNKVHFAPFIRFH